MADGQANCFADQVIVQLSCCQVSSYEKVKFGDGDTYFFDGTHLYVRVVQHDMSRLNYNWGDRTWYG